MSSWRYKFYIGAVLVAAVTLQGLSASPPYDYNLEQNRLENRAESLGHDYTIPDGPKRAEPRWKQEAVSKNQRTNNKIPSLWKLSPNVLRDALAQQRLIGHGNMGKSIDDLIRTLPQANFTNPYIPGLVTSANKTINITNSDPVDIVASMLAKHLTAVDVVTAFCLRSSIIHRVHPVLLDVAFAEGIKIAQDLDKYLLDNGKLKGDLHGLPISFKDVFHAANLEASGSFVGWFEPPAVPSPPRTQAQYRYGTIRPTNFEQNPKTFDSTVAQLLKTQGAIPIAKTSVMQTTWAVDTENNYLGYLTNPYNKNLSAGGSSGGEGVLQALRGAAFGIGEDSGGSISMPSSLHGLYSLKPSSGFYFKRGPNGTEELLPIAGRMSMDNAINFGTRLQCAEVTAAGIMARSLRAVQYIYQSTVKGPSKSPTISKGFSFAYLDNDGAITPHPPIQRAMNMVKKGLGIASGTQPRKWNGTAPHMVSDIHGTLARADDIIDTVHYKNLTGEPFAAVLEIDSTFNPQPWDSAKQQAMDSAVRLRDKYRQEYESLLQEHALDALIMPTFASTNWAKGAGDSAVSYTSWANVLNVPSVTMFVTHASQSIDQKPTSFAGLSQDDATHMKLYDPPAVDGTPVSVMIMGRLNGEMELLEAAEAVQQALMKV